MSPAAPLFFLVGVMDLVGVPVGLYMVQERFGEFLLGLDDAIVWQAYWCTVYAVVMLWLCYRLFGTRRNMQLFQLRPMAPIHPAVARRVWMVTLALTWLAILVFWLQAGRTVPVLQTLGREYMEYALLRTQTRMAVNQLLFNGTLYLLATPNLLVALTALPAPRTRYVLISVLTLLSVCSFTLARSPLALTGVIALHYLLLSRPRSARFVLPGMALFATALVLNHLVAGGPEGYASVWEYLGARVVFGEWAALPHFFDLFRSNPLPWRAILPAQFQQLTGGIVDSPARLVIMKLVPGVEDEGTGGAANGFFIGDAFAVAGMTGVYLAPIWVGIQYWFVSKVFSRLPKTPITTFLYAWILFKMLIAVLGGFSAFLASSLELSLVILLYVTLARRAVRGEEVPA